MTSKPPLLLMQAGRIFGAVGALANRHAYPTKLLDALIRYNLTPLLLTYINLIPVIIKQGIHKKHLSFYTPHN
jgi:hypothetical protein